MANNSKITVEHIIAKIDNDFNPDNSDWIPRVAAWCTDAMSQLKILRTVKRERKLAVIERIAKSPCCIDDNELKVYADGCEVKRLDRDSCCWGSSPTGGLEQTNTIEYCNPNGSKTREVIDTGETEEVVFSEHVNTIIERDRHNVYSIKSAPRRERNYVISGNTIELNFDTDNIIIINKEVETQHSEYYHCEIPVIPNNGLLAEALAYYCMYKMLCRGYKHPVFNLQASQYGTNPYYMWTQLKDKAKISVINGQQGDDNDAWRKFFINSMIP